MMQPSSPNEVVPRRFSRLRKNAGDFRAGEKNSREVKQMKCTLFRRVVLLIAFVLASITWGTAQDFVRQNFAGTIYNSSTLPLRLSPFGAAAPLNFDMGAGTTVFNVNQVTGGTNIVQFAQIAVAANHTWVFPDFGPLGVPVNVMGAVSAVSCGATTTCAATATPAVKIAFGSVPLTSGTPSTATVTGLPTFTSTSTFSCVATEATAQANNTLKVVNASVNSITITGAATNTDTINYFCWGT